MSVLDQECHSEGRAPSSTPPTAAAVPSSSQGGGGGDQGTPPSISSSSTEGQFSSINSDSPNGGTAPLDAIRNAVHYEMESGSSILEEGTIDAAVVEEILDTSVDHATPPLSQEIPRTSSAAQPILATANMIPEVQPEVDIEEIHVLRRFDASHISAVSALTTTSGGGEEDSKLPATPWEGMPRYAPIRAPMVPPRQPVDYRGVSAGTALTSAAVMMANQRQVSNDTALAMDATVTDEEVDLPDYKDQSRPRIPSGSPPSSRNVSNGSNHTGGSGSHPSARLQYTHSQRISSATPMDVDVDEVEHIPVVDAILVPAERLAAEEAMQYGNGPTSSQRHSAGSSSTLSTSHTSSHNNASHGSSNSNDPHLPPTSGENASRSKSSERPISERRFWVTVIVAALLLNSLLVAGAVVGGFCAAGKCSSSSAANASNNVATNGAPPPASGTGPLVPSPSPSRSLSSPSLVPTVATSATESLIPTIVSTAEGYTIPPGGGDLLPAIPTRSPAPSRAFAIDPSTPYPTTLPFGTRAPTISPAPFNMKFSPVGTSSGSSGTNAPAGFETTITSMEPTLLFDEPGAAVNPTFGREPSGKDDLFVPPSASPSVPRSNYGAPSAAYDNGYEDDNGGGGVSLAVLVPVLVGLEAVIILGLLLYYRWWKRQKMLFSEYDSFLAPETVNTSATGDSSSSNTGAGGGGVIANPPLYQTTLRSSTGVSGTALSTIEECESHDHDQYSV